MPMIAITTSSSTSVNPRREAEPVFMIAILTIRRPLGLNVYLKYSANQPT